MGLLQRWKHARSAAAIAECGTGKTLISLGAVHCHAEGKPYTALAMVPPQLVDKWAREAIRTVPWMRVFMIDGLRTPTKSTSHNGVNEVRLRNGRIAREGLRTSLTDLRLRGTARTARERWNSSCDSPALFIAGRDRGKLSYFWRHAYEIARCGRYQGSVVNPESGIPVYTDGEDENRLLADDFKKAKLSEVLNGTRRPSYSALWQADGNKIRRYAPIDFIGRYMGDGYPGVDLVYYGNQSQLEYDFVVAPGADPNQIKLSFAGADGMRIDAVTGDLVLKVGSEEVRLRKPAISQSSVEMAFRSPNNTLGAVPGGNEVSRNPGVSDLDGEFVLASNRSVSFRLAGYDPKRALIIDPVLSYSTYLGGSSADAGNAIAVDSEGNAYVTGYTYSPDFPTANQTPGACVGTCGTGAGAGNSEVFVTKINPAGNTLVYSTYIGGSSYDWSNGIATDAAGNAYLTGYTASSDFPIVNQTPGGCMGTCGTGAGADAFVAKINPSGSALAYSTYLGGSSSDSGRAIVVDAAGNAYVTGITSSLDFPTANALQGACRLTIYGQCPLEGFVIKLSTSGSALVYSTYLGGSGGPSDNGDASTGIAVDVAGYAYVTGTTWANDFPTLNQTSARQ
jgi:hypothetical protein